MNQPQLLNPNQGLLVELELRLRLANKTKLLWARQVKVTTNVESPEGVVVANAGDFVCRGIHGEYWAQKKDKLFAKYSAMGEIDAEGWQRFEPIPEAAPVEAAQVPYAFRVVAQWGELNGRPNDYVVRSTQDPLDIWIVGRAIFDASYEFKADSDVGDNCGSVSQSRPTA